MMVSGKFNREEATWKNHIFTGLTADLLVRATIRVIAGRDLLLFGYAMIDEALRITWCAFIIAENNKSLFSTVAATGPNQISYDSYDNSYLIFVGTI